MHPAASEKGELVHCRTGSLEKPNAVKAHQGNVHCRTGSLEKC
ncbi:hypothetical protein Q7C_1030 [Methylophaga frappieri]|uniref:Uncharacterized protein n=1 Tax=Methylophaga frappieri (strain ATCC BAA-2434 / DSM 25690 / JAM7) TaxID=754477 RepID=I1YGZ6_METFJ|nr:hypothetical protein Q7C_1030 [Methylophaga frappieri]